MSSLLQENSHSAMEPSELAVVIVGKECSGLRYKMGPLGSLVEKDVLLESHGAPSGDRFKQVPPGLP
ncbi:MAG: hypothetical protein JMM79_02180 [Candidatus Xiphinematobacter sp.]|nr:MAG: hypothetical protein JMM79_02180 [Candidatus Xiphinematobacter sp.]